MEEYVFNPVVAFSKIIIGWEDWAKNTHTNKIIVGLTGEKNSTVTAAMGIELFGADNVYCVSLLNTSLSNDNHEFMRELIQDIGINPSNYIEDNIAGAYNSIVGNMLGNLNHVSENTKINLPARLRMSVLYAYAQSIGAKVMCTNNLSENIIGDSTFYGDHAGAFAPLADFTATEVAQIGNYMGINPKFILAPHSYDSCGTTDEEKLGFKYEDLDRYIRGQNNCLSQDQKKRIHELNKKNKFKTDIVNIPFSYSGYPDRFCCMPF